jgi:hypothetical protein
MATAKAAHRTITISLRIRFMNYRAPAPPMTVNLFQSKSLNIRKKTFIYVNNRLEGNALETISAMLEQSSMLAPDEPL